MTGVHYKREKFKDPNGLHSGRNDTIYRRFFGGVVATSNGLLIMPEKYRRPHTHERVQAVERMQRDWAAQRQSLATVRRFNASLSARGYSWFWPKIAAALVSKHHRLVILCDSCGTVVDLDLRVKPRDPEASIRVALRDVRCSRCNGYGRPRIIALSQHPS
jgi:hypothetical protein